MKNTASKFITVFTLLFTLLCGTQDSLAQVFQESGGLVVIEMENSPSPLGQWIEITPGQADYVSGATGSKHLEFTGNSISGGNPNSPRTYTFTINQAGNYYLNLRARKRLDGAASDLCNDCYVKMSGNFTSGSASVPLSALTQSTKLYGGNAGDWGWATNLDGNGADHTACVYNLLAGQTYTLTISGRSQRFNLDRIVLRHSSVAVAYARDTARPESSTAGGPPYTYQATVDFPSLTGGEVPYYVDAARTALAIDAANTSYRGKFARAALAFDGVAGTYTATITALQELDGECTYRLLVNGVVVGTATNAPTGTDYTVQDHVFNSITIPAGAALAVESNTHSNGKIPETGGFAWARGRWRQLTITTGGVEPPPTVTQLMLINADTDADMWPLTNGVELNLSLLPTTNLNVRADTLPATVGSVRLTLDGSVKVQTENVAPYALYGDAAGDYNPWTPALGAHTLAATAYSGADATGTAGTPLTVNFTVIDEAPGTPQVNAGADQVVILPTNVVSLAGSATDNVSITNVLWTQQSGPNTAALAGQTTLNLSASGLVQGTYVFRLTATDNEGNSAFDEASVYVVPEGTGDAVITGELKKWHKVTLSFTGPPTSEAATPNPFTDYRLNVTFSHAASGKTLVVPGYFAADGNAANSGAAAGNVWRAHLAPEETGIWTYAASFRTGANVATDESSTVGVSAGYFDGSTGTFAITPTDKTGRDFRGKGRLDYVGKHHLQFAETGEYFLKCGADAPENLLAYADFDGDFKTDGTEDSRIKTWSAHVADWQPGDPVWQGTKGKGLIGAINYLASEGLNAFSFLTMNINGDDKNVFPYTAYGERARMDCSRLDQWELVFEHGTRKGMYLHFKTQETENELLLDGGDTGPQRKLYYRELIARFGHNLALNWNLGEEINNASTAQKQSWAQYLYDHDPYRHHSVIHNGANHYELMGSASKLTGFSLQTSLADFSEVHSKTLDYLTRSVTAGKPWVVACDEPGDAQHALRPDNDAGTSHTDGRKNALWGNVMAGGAGLEFYFGYDHAHSDLTCEDFRSRDAFWDYCRYLLQFFVNNGVPFWDMANDNALSTAANDYCLYKPNHTYVVYLKNGGTTSLDLTGATGTYQIRWYDPRNGGALQLGSVPAVPAGGVVGLGNPPGAATSDWAVIITAGLPGQNFPPQANAGPDQTQVLLPGNTLSLVLDGSVVDDGLPDGNAVTSLWSQVSGPAVVSFGDPTLPRTVATFTTLGTYVLKLTASDQELAGSDNVTITLANSVGGQELVVGPTDDAYLQGSGETLFNTADLRVEAGNRVSYLKFTVNNAGGLAGATLKLTEGNDVGNGTFNLFAGSHNNWTETTLSAATKPAKVGGALASYSGTVADGQTLSFNVGAFVTGNGTYSFVVEHASGNDVSFASSESTVATPPQLVLSLPNTPPSAEIITPTNGVVFPANTPVSVTATASDAEGAIASMELFLNGASLGELAGGSNSWAMGVLPGGTHQLVVVATDGSGTVASDLVNITTVAPQQLPHGGTPFNFPGLLEVELFDVGGQGLAYHDVDATNHGGAVLRAGEGVDVEARVGVSGGHNVGWMEAGEWLEYTVNILSGPYTLVLRSASTHAVPGSIEFSLDGQPIATVPVTSSGGWYNWTTPVTNGIEIIGGTNKVLRMTVVSPEAGPRFNLDFAVFNLQTTPPPTFTAAPVVTPEGLVMSWNTVAGRSYQLWFKDALSDPDWTALDDPVTATGSQMSMTNDPGTVSRRFFRIEELP